MLLRSYTQLACTHMHTHTHTQRKMCFTGDWRGSSVLQLPSHYVQCQWLGLLRCSRIEAEDLFCFTQLETQRSLFSCNGSHQRSSLWCTLLTIPIVVSMYKHWLLGHSNYPPTLEIETETLGNLQYTYIVAILSPRWLNSECYFCAVFLSWAVACSLSTYVST